MGYAASSLPSDLRMECLYICRGYRRRRQALAKRLAVIRDGGANAERFRADPEVQKVYAVEAALGRFGAQGTALLQNLTDQTPYEYLDIPMGRQMFYHCRAEFLEAVAQYLGYIRT